MLKFYIIYILISPPLPLNPGYATDHGPWDSPRATRGVCCPKNRASIAQVGCHGRGGGHGQTLVMAAPPCFPAVKKNHGPNKISERKILELLPTVAITVEVSFTNNFFKIFYKKIKWLIWKHCGSGARKGHRTPQSLLSLWVLNLRY